MIWVKILFFPFYLGFAFTYSFIHFFWSPMYIGAKVMEPVHSYIVIAYMVTEGREWRVDQNQPHQTL